jgi:hypothetical protein
MKRMKMLGALAFTAAGAIAGAAITIGFHRFEQMPVVHAEDQFTTFAGCVSGVPKSWGNFMGASSYGLAFQDEKGTVRFVQHPVCGAQYDTSAPVPSLGLEILRK